MSHRHFKSLCARDCIDSLATRPLCKTFANPKLTITVSRKERWKPKAFPGVKWDRQVQVKRIQPPKDSWIVTPILMVWCTYQVQNLRTLGKEWFYYFYIILFVSDKKDHALLYCTHKIITLRARSKMWLHTNQWHKSHYQSIS